MVTSVRSQANADAEANLEVVQLGVETVEFLEPELVAELDVREHGRRDVVDASAVEAERESGGAVTPSRRRYDRIPWRQIAIELDLVRHRRVPAQPQK